MYVCMYVLSYLMAFAFSARRSVILLRSVDCGDEDDDDDDDDDVATYARNWLGDNTVI
jgi:hypothetical protein